MPKRSRCVFTNVHNEHLFFPLWLRYYSQYFEPHDIYVIHLVRPVRFPFDDWMVQQNFRVIPILDRNYRHEQLIVNWVTSIQHELLADYHSVLYTDVDEFVWSSRGLGLFIDEYAGDVERCTGYEVVQSIEEEPDLDLSRPLLAQRKYWYYSPIYSKPLLARIPLTYNVGFHDAVQSINRRANPELLLIHLKKMDYKLALARNLERQASEQGSEAFKKRMTWGEPGYHAYLDHHNLEKWWYLSADTGQHANFELIPDHVGAINI